LFSLSVNQILDFSTSQVHSVGTTSSISVLLILVYAADVCRSLLKGTIQREVLPLKDWSLDLMISQCSFGNPSSTSTPKLAWQVISRYLFFFTNFTICQW